MNDIALKIKELIDKKRIPLIELSEKIGKTRNTLYNYLNNTTVIDVETLQKMADVLEVPVTYFFGGSETVTNSEREKELERELELMTYKYKAVASSFQFLAYDFSHDITQAIIHYHWRDSELIKTGTCNESRIKELENRFLNNFLAFNARLVNIDYTVGNLILYTTSWSEHIKRLIVDLILSKVIKDKELVLKPDLKPNLSIYSIESKESTI